MLPMNLGALSAAEIEHVVQPRWEKATDIPIASPGDNPNMAALQRPWAQGTGNALGSSVDMGNHLASFTEGDSLGMTPGESGVSPYAGMEPQAMGDMLRQRMLQMSDASQQMQDGAVQQNRDALMQGKKLGF